MLSRHSNLEIMSLKIESEVKLESEPCVLAWDDKLFVGVEDGSIKTFDANLTPGISWTAHTVQPFALAAGQGKVYSSSNDGGVRVWSADGQKITELRTGGADVGALTFSGTDVITGDEDGNVIVFKNDSAKALYNVLEEIKDVQYSPPFMFTVRDLYVTVTEIQPEESKSRFVTRHTMEGRAPIKLAGNWLVVTARGGNSLRLHYATVDKEFKLMHEVKVSDMIVTSVAVDGDFVWTGGWDGHIRMWQIVNDQLQAVGDLNIGSCVNSLVAHSNSVYAAVTGGLLAKIKSV